MAPPSASALGEDAIRQMKVVDLKAELGALGLSTAGRKDELVERLLEAVAAGSRSASAPLSPGGAAAAAARPLSPPAAKAASPAGSGPSGASSSGAMSPVDPTNMASRASRFGLPATSPVASPAISPPAILPPAKVAKIGVADASLMDLARMRARQERFGVTVSSSLADLQVAEDKKKRAERFNL